MIDVGDALRHSLNPCRGNQHRVASENLLRVEQPCRSFACMNLAPARVARIVRQTPIANRCNIALGSGTATNVSRSMTRKSPCRTIRRMPLAFSTPMKFLGQSATSTPETECRSSSKFPASNTLISTSSDAVTNAPTRSTSTGNENSTVASSPFPSSPKNAVPNGTSDTSLIKPPSSPKPNESVRKSMIVTVPISSSRSVGIGFGTG